MAYSATSTVEQVSGDTYKVTITETEASSTSETSFTLPPGSPIKKAKLVNMVRVWSDKVSGTAATLQPRLGSAAGASGRTIQYQATAAASIDEQPAEEVVMLTADGVLYHRAQPNAGSDNSIVTVYLIGVEW